MKKIMLGVAALLFSINALVAQQKEELTVATFNIRYDNPGDAPDTWSNRLPAVSGLIQFHEFDTFGIQEGLAHQVKQLDSVLVDFTYLGVGRDDGKEAGEYAAIFYKPSKFEVLDSGTFWLSENTTTPNKGWDAALPRICTWAKMKSIQSGREFFLFNTHFDHRGVEARVKSATLILSKIEKIAGSAPVILMGDFNVDQDSAPYAEFINSKGVKDAYQHAALVYASNGTFNQFNTELESDKRIDHIFLKGDFDIQKYGILTDTYRGHFPSDHFPVMVKVGFN
jgi:endonuclease/exonuclease/phosphatase family metal-dependent hydrolase